MLRRVLVITAVLALAVLANADSAPGFPYPPNWTATHVDADWYDISVDPGGMWYLANFTIIPDPGHEYDWCGTVSGFYWVASTGGEWHQFGFDLPLQGLSV